MASSPERPSTWRLLFGGNKSHRGTEPRDGDRRSANQDESESDVAARLLHTLSDRARQSAPEDAIGRECCEELLGGHNEFAPQLLRRGLAGAPAATSAESAEQQRARDIISARMAVDQRADAIRRAKTQGQRRRDDAEARAAPRPRADPAERLQKLRAIQTRRDEQEKTRREANARQEHKASRATKSEPRAPEPRQRAARSNQDETPDQAALAREYQALEAKLRRLKAENQRAAELEERMLASKQVLRIQKRVWAIWRERVARRRREEASVTCRYEWRRLQRFWAAWRRVVSAAKRERVAARVQTQLIREKQLADRAETFSRAKQLLRWFHRWLAATNVSREARAADREAQQRRERAQRLVERLAKTHGSHVPPQQQREPTAQHSPSHAGTPVLTERPRPQRKAAWAVQARPVRAEAKPKPVPSPDAFYASMQERAQRRKAQREQLRLRYEQQERDKREALARQVADREALLEQQKHEERERFREQRRAQARLAREKAERREVEAIQLQSARLHDRLRLLFHYAWKPWQQRWLARRRVARTADQWHALRLAHRSWTAWRSFVESRLAQRRRLAQARLQAADEHHRQTLLRSTLMRWRLARQATQRKSLALERQAQWNAARRAWTTWRRALAVARGREQQQVRRARGRVERRRLSAVLSGWRGVAAQSKRERVRQAEKDELWKKARLWLDG